uniref:C-type lectin domain-containing protein n=1 Tax=Xiphophorus couchianus TaxID=32473 RepID=A0A3B5KZ80_9TELE
MRTCKVAGFNNCCFLWMFSSATAPGLTFDDVIRLLSAAYKKCPAGWTRYRGDCYLYDDTELTWIQAELHCISNHGNLATLQNRHQYAFLRRVIFKSAGSHKRTWVGGHDGVKEGTWLWSRGEKFDFTPWGPGEPNNFEGNEDCMEINLCYLKTCLRGTGDS